MQGPRRQLESKTATYSTPQWDQQQPEWCLCHCHLVLHKPEGWSPGQCSRSPAHSAAAATSWAGISEQAGPAPGRWPLFMLLVNYLPALGLVFGAYLLVPYLLHLVFTAHKVQGNALGLHEVLQSWCFGQKPSNTTEFCWVLLIFFIFPFPNGIFILLLAFSAFFRFLVPWWEVWFDLEASANIPVLLVQTCLAQTSLCPPALKCCICLLLPLSLSAQSTTLSWQQWSVQDEIEPLLNVSGR